MPDKRKRKPGRPRVRVVGAKCQNGHPLVGDNVKVHLYKGGEYIECRKCWRLYDRNYKREMRAKE